MGNHPTGPTWWLCFFCWFGISRHRQSTLPMETYVFSSCYTRRPEPMRSCIVLRTGLNISVVCLIWKIFENENLTGGTIAWNYPMMIETTDWHPFIKIRIGLPSRSTLSWIIFPNLYCTEWIFKCFVTKIDSCNGKSHWLQVTQWSDSCSSEYHITE